MSPEYGEEVVFQVERVPRLDSSEASFLDFPKADFFRGTCSFPNEITAVLAEIKVDDHKLSTGSKRLMD